MALQDSPPRRGAAAPDQSATDAPGLFEEGRICSFHMTVSPEDWAGMQPRRPQGPPPPRPEPTAARTPEYVRGSVSCGDRTYRDVAIRLKGNSSLRGCAHTPKKPFLLDFGLFSPGQQCRGHRRLAFSNGFKDPSLLREVLAYDLFGKAGVAAPRAAFARVYLTVEGVYCREYLGLYTAVEHLDEQFLENRFGSGAGLLAEVDHLPDLLYLGQDWADFAPAFDLRSAGDTSDTDHLIEFTRFLHQADDGEFARKIAGRLNVESFLAYLAVNVVLANLDSYMGTGHNYFLHHNTGTGRYELIPLDLNEAFGSFRMGSARQMLDLDVYRPVAGRKVLVDRLLSIEPHRARYTRCVTDLVEGPFSVDRAQEQISRRYALIREAVLADTHKLYASELFERSIAEDVELERHLPSGPPPPPLPRPGAAPGRHGDRPPPPAADGIFGLKRFAARRVDSIRAQLRGERRGHTFEQ